MGSQQAGERAAVVLSLIKSAKLNGHDPWAYLKDVFERLAMCQRTVVAHVEPFRQATTSGLAAIPSLFADLISDHRSALYLFERLVAINPVLALLHLRKGYLPALKRVATYLGHVHISGPQRYLTMTPELLRLASLRFERYALGGKDHA